MDQKILTLRLPKGVHLNIQFVEAPSLAKPAGGQSLVVGPVADPNVALPVKTDAEGNLAWDGCGCGNKSNCIC